MEMPVMEVFPKRYKRTSAEAFNRVEPPEIVFFVLHIKYPSLHTRNRTLRQSAVTVPVNSYYKILRVVYGLDTKHRLSK